MDELLIAVGRLPRTKRGEKIRRIIAETLRRHPAVAVRFGDDAERPKDLRALFDRAFITLFDISGSRDVRVFADLGYALGRGRYAIVLQGRNPVSVAGFPGDENVDYGSSLKQLRQALASSVTEWIGAAVRKYSAAGEVLANMDARILEPVARSLLAMDLVDGFTVAGDHGLSEEQVETTLAVLEGFGMARETAAGWRITKFGRDHLPRLLAGMA